jgi:UDP-N-acetyl-D-glucosamine dehydrogenase
MPIPSPVTQLWNTSLISGSRQISNVHSKMWRTVDLTEPRLSTASDGTQYAIPSEAEQQAHFEELGQRAQSAREAGQQVVIVQGLGFVGAAVAAVVANAVDADNQPLFFVIGIELATPNGYWKVTHINEGQCPIVTPDQQLADLTREAALTHKNLCATVSPLVYGLADVIVVDIQLDVKDHSETRAGKIDVDLATFESSMRTIGQYMAPDALVLVETTVPYGISEKVVTPVLQEERQKRGIGGPLYVAHAYERVMPGPRYVDSIRAFWRTFSGINPESTEKARAFLSAFIDTENYPLAELADTNSSELAKLLENSYRAVNIAFIHEWALLAERSGINLFEVINAIRVRKGTHDNIRLPGFGVGGYCLTKDSLLAQWAGDHLFDTDVELSMTLSGLSINYDMPLHTLELLQELFEPGSLSGQTIVVCGVAYLPGVADTRNTPTERLVNELEALGTSVIVHDPYVTEWPEKPNVTVHADLAACLQQADGVVLTVPHPEYRTLSAEALLAMLPKKPNIVDAQNILTDESAKILVDGGCRLLGVGKGHWRKNGYHS